MELRPDGPCLVGPDELRAARKLADVAEESFNLSYIRPQVPAIPKCEDQLYPVTESQLEALEVTALYASRRIRGRRAGRYMLHAIDNIEDRTDDPTLQPPERITVVKDLSVEEPIDHCESLDPNAILKNRRPLEPVSTIHTW